MIVLGIDPGTAALGYGIVERNGGGLRAVDFGVLKTTNEYVGVVRANEFELWERQQRAVHARGRVVPRHRGSRVEVSLVIPRRTRFLVGLFFALAMSVVGLYVGDQGPFAGPYDALVGACAGAGLIAIVGWLGEVALKKEAMGMGDVTLMAFAGAVLGPSRAIVTVGGR